MTYAPPADRPIAFAPWHAWAFAAVGMGLSLLCFAPRFWLWPALGAPDPTLAGQPELHRAYFSLQQLHAPWERVNNPTNRVMEWRLLFPATGHLLRLPDRLYLALPWLGALLALQAAAAWVLRATNRPAVACGAALLAATGSWFFVSTGWLAYFDSWLVLCLLLASHARSRATLFTVALLAPWIDERFIIAVPVCLAIRRLEIHGRPASGGGEWGHDARALLLGIAPYLVIRLGAEAMHVRETSRGYWADWGTVWRTTSFTTLLAGNWHGLRLGWLPVCAAIAFALRSPRRWAWFLPLALLLGLAFSQAIAADLSRSLVIALPVLLAGLIFAWQRWPGIVPAAALVLAGGNLLLPAEHVVATFQLPIASLFTEWEAWRNPPDLVNPIELNRRGLSLARTDPDESQRLLTLALYLDPGFGEARANRGLLRFRHGQPEAGLADLDAALAAEPTRWQFRLTRVRLRLERGDEAGAREDLRVVLAGAPANSSERAIAVDLARHLGEIP
jgi:hypothetical protein